MNPNDDPEGLFSDAGFSLPLDTPSLVCLALGVLIVVVLSAKKFEESTLDVEADLTAQLLPKYLATPEQYSRALFLYIASLVGILCLLSVVGPRLLELSTQLKPFKPVAPIGFALLLVGALTSLPWLQDIEWRIRRFWHERAYIPSAARATADTLRASNFDFSPYAQPAVRTSASMLGVEPTDFKAPRGTIEHRWARLSCLSYELSRRRNAGDVEALHSEILDRYAADLDTIAAKRKDLEAEMANYRKEKKKNSFYENIELNKSITSSLKKLYILLACAVRLKATPVTDVNAVFRSFGFVLPPSAAPPSNYNLIIMALSVMTASLFALTFAAVTAASIGISPSIWKPSDAFPRNMGEPFMWSLSALLVHGCAILTADWARARLLAGARWFAVVGQERQPIGANYIRMAVCCALAGGTVLYLWGLIFQKPTLGLATSTAAFSILPAATGAFYCYHLDNVELKRRPLRWWEIASQSVVTGLCGLVAMPVWLGSVKGNADVIAMVTLFGAIVGASLAWYLPQAATSLRWDPVTEAHNGRIAMLKTAAAGYFKTAERADQWLRERHRSLNNQTPIEAAADIGFFVKALGLLHEPLAADAPSRSRQADAPNHSRQANDTSVANDLTTLAVVASAPDISPANGKTLHESARR